MADEYKKLVPGINPAASTDEEWFSVPVDHQYQGYVRVNFNGSISDTASEFKIYGLDATGNPLTNENIEARNTLEYGDFAYFNFDMGPGETLSVWADSTFITFNFRGLDIDG